MKKLGFVSLSILLFAASCGTAKSNKSQSFNLESTSWHLELLGGESIATQGDSFRLTFDTEGRLNAKGSCNPIVGSYSQSGEDSLTLSPLGMTRMMCPDMQLEAAFITALEAATTFEVVDNTLILLDGEVVLARFKMQ